MYNKRIYKFHLFVQKNITLEIDYRPDTELDPVHNTVNKMDNPLPSYGFL